MAQFTGILAKVPWSVQRSILQGLEVICSSSDDMSRKAAAKLNLACAYVNGIGVDNDLGKAAELVKEAADMGSVRAQSLYINVFSSIKGARSVGDETWAMWLQNSANDGNPVALSKLRSVSETGWTNAMRTRSTKELFSGQDESLETDFDSRDSGVFDWINWQRHFLRFAVLNGLVDFAKALLDSDESLLHLQQSDGETPLIVSCRQGHLRLAKMLIEKGANPRQSTKEGVTALHWAVSFPPEEQETFVTFLADRGVDVEATAVVAQGRPDVFNSVGLPMTGTPLHWAVARNAFAMVEALLKGGADPASRPPSSTGEIHLTPFKLACHLCRSSILDLFLQDAAIRAIVNVPRPLVENRSVRVRPLFMTLGSTPRWERLMRLGAAYEEEIKETIRLLLQNGAGTDAVLELDHGTMSAAFATAYHQCTAEVMRWGLEFGFRNQIDSTFFGASSGGTALFLAITHRDREMFQELLNAGANLAAVDMDKFNALHRAAKENDDVFFTQKLLEAGIPLEPDDPALLSAFFIATYAGNLNVARYLYDQGADRDRPTGDLSKTILATMLLSHTRTAAKRVEFLLSLPDRGSDGFLCMADGGDKWSAYHCATSRISENPADVEIAWIMVSLLLDKYSDKKYLNSVEGPDNETTIAMATKAGNYKVVQALLKAGADPDIQDKNGRTALDKGYWRYCYPELTHALRDIDLNDKLLVGRTLNHVNHNTSEILTLLKSYDAKTGIFHFPAWFDEDPGHRNLNWVLARLQENRTPEAQRFPDRPLQIRPR